MSKAMIWKGKLQGTSKGIKSFEFFFEDIGEMYEGF